MGSKVEQQYKLLNAELMDQVQKQRLEIGEYRKRVITLEREIMDIREEHVLQNHRQRMENISIVRSLMLSLNVDSDSLVVPEEPAHGALINRPSGPRRSSREICKDMRRTCVLARNIRPISPSRSSSGADSSTIRRSNAEVQSNVEASRVTEDRKSKKPTPTPRRPAELVFDEDDSDDDFDDGVGPVHNNNEEAQTEQNEENNRLFSIIEENGSEGETTESSSSCEAIYCDTTVESSPPNAQTTVTPRGRALREVDPNVPIAVAVSLSRGKGSGKGSRLITPAPVDDSPQEQSIQCPRLAVTRPSQSSGIFPDVNGLTPRRSLFNGISQLAGSTSTPKSFLVEEMPSIRTRSRTATKKKSENTDMSSSFSNTSGRPSRSCKPSSLVEPSLRNKMRSDSTGRAKAKK